MANYIFSTKNQMIKGLEKVLKEIVTSLADKVYRELYKNVDENIYSWSPSRYHRTMQVLKSIAKTNAVYKDGGWQCVIYFDVSKISPQYRMPSGWNAHASFNGDIVDGNDLIKWLNEGTDNKYYSHPSYGFWDDTINWLYHEYNEMFKKELINQGIKLL